MSRVNGTNRHPQRVPIPPEQTLKVRIEGMVRAWAALAGEEVREQHQFIALAPYKGAALYEMREVFIVAAVDRQESILLAFNLAASAADGYAALRGFLEVRPLAEYPM